MARTPEAKVKDKLRKLFGFYGVEYFMPVQSGYGAPALDFICCHLGRYFQVETKARNGEMTPRQKTIARLVENAGGKAFLINDDENTWKILVAWLKLGSE